MDIDAKVIVKFLDIADEFKLTSEEFKEYLKIMDSLFDDAVKLVDLLIEKRLTNGKV